MKQGNQISCQLNNAMKMIMMITGFSTALDTYIAFKIRFLCCEVRCGTGRVIPSDSNYCLPCDRQSRQSGRGPSLNNPGQSPLASPGTGGNVWPGHSGHGPGQPDQCSLRAK